MAYIDLEVNDKNIKRLSDYMRRDGDIRDKHFLYLVEQKFGLSSDIWIQSDTHQINSIKQAIQKIQMLPTQSALDVSDIIHANQTLSTKQVKYLEEFKKALNKQELEQYIDDFMGKGLLDKKLENQSFLTELIELTYKKGLYEIIHTFLLSNLYISYRQQTNIQKIEAHTCGSLEKYDEAKHILHQLIHENTIENINLRTSALSNHKRALFAQNNVDAETLYLLIKGYRELHAIEGIYSYYTGINLLYMVILGQLRFKDDKRFLSIETRKIYEQSKPSLKIDTTHEAYYVYMSNFEFQLLLGKKSIISEIEYFLEDKKPHISLTERTLRQMKLFVFHSQNTQHPIIQTFNKIISLLTDYMEQ